MRIERLTVNGFGVLSDMVSPDFGPGLNVIYGENGAGKSTLLEFVRAILFGFRGAGGLQYKPVSSGRHGGEIHVAMADGRRIRISREPGKPVAGIATATLEGAPLSLEALLGGATRDLFEHVFAFSLADIDEAGALNEGDLQNRIYAAAAGTGAAGAPAIVARLNREIEEIFKPNASNPAINAMLAAHKRLAEERKRLAGGADRYAEAMEALRRAVDRLRLAEEAERATAAWLDQVDLLSRAHGIWLAAEELTIRIEDHEGPDALPPDARERLRHWLTESERLQKAVGEAEQELGGLQSRLAVVQVDEALLEQRGAVADLTGSRSELEQALQKLPELVAKLEAEEGRVAQQVAELGEGWTLDRVAAHAATVELTEGVAERAKEIETAERSVAAAREMADRLSAAAAQAEGEADAARDGFGQTWPGEPTDEAVVAERRSDVAATREDLHGRTAVELQIVPAQARVRELEQRTAGVTNPAQAADRTALWLIPAQAVAVILLVLALGPTLLAGVVAAAAVAALGIGAHLMRRGGSAQAVHVAEAAARADGDTVTARAELERLRSALKELDDRIALRACRLGLPPLPSPADLDQKERLLDGLANAAAARSNAQAEALTKAAAARTARAASDEQARRLTDALAALAVLADAWRAWAARHDLNPALSPAGARALLQAAGSAKQMALAAEELRKQRDSAATTITRIMAAAGSLASALGEEPPTEGGCGAAISAWHTRTQAADRAAAERAGLNGQVKARQASIAELQSRLTEVRDALAALLREAGRPTVEDLQRLISLYDDKCKLREELRQRRTELLVVYRTEEALAAARGALEAARADDLPRRLEEARAELARLRADLGAAQTDVGKRQTSVEQLETAVDLERTGTELADTQRKMQEAADRWIVLRTCKWLMEQAIKVHETTRQPEVLRLAGDHLRAITAGRYRGMFTPVGQSDVVLQTDADQPRASWTWNRGLKEQAYLALRLGFIQNYCASSEPLPIVIDDVLANSDPDHARRTAERLCGMAETLQIIYLTCHPETVEEFRQVAGGRSAYLTLSGRKLYELPAA